MKFARRWLAGALVVSSLALPAWAQRKERDPLTDAEVDQMREAADYPNKRLELLVKFTRERVFAIESLRADTPSAENDKKIHDLIEDFISVLDEIDDNIDMY